MRLLAFVAVTLLSSAAAWAGESGDSPFGGSGAALLEKTALCTDEKSHFVALVPHELRIYQLYSGDGKVFVKVPLPKPTGLPGSDFLDPRHFNKDGNADFRGVDMRVYSSIEADAEKKTCALRCGAKEVSLKLLPSAEGRGLLTQARYLPSPQKRVPYALARDDRGVYYYVDRGSSPDQAKSYRLFVGPKGQLKLQKMKDVVSDSEGEIFATANGRLRLLLDKNAPSTWISPKGTRPLKAVPISQNLPMIYSELGVYAADRLGTPCDDF